MPYAQARRGDAAHSRNSHGFDGCVLISDGISGTTGVPEIDAATGWAALALFWLFEDAARNKRSMQAGLEVT